MVDEPGIFYCDYVPMSRGTFDCSTLEGVQAAQKAYDDRIAYLKANNIPFEEIWKN